MKPPRKSSKSPTTPPAATLPAHELERETQLHLFCQRIADRKTKGIPIARTCQRIASVWNRKPFKTAPDRHWKLSTARLLNLYFDWKRGGEHPSAFRLRYVRDQAVPHRIARAFVGAVMGSASMAAAVRLLEVRRRRRGARQRLPGDDVFYRLLPKGYFRQLVAARRAVRMAETELARLHLALEVHVLARVRPPRKRSTFRCTPNFSI